MEDESEYSIKQIQNTSDLMLYASAVKTVNEIKSREKKDQSKVDECNKLLQDLQNEDTRSSTIQQIQKNYKTEFDKNDTLYKQAFESGMKEQKEDMSKPDYKWEDPITHMKPKGGLAKANQIIKGGINKLQDLTKTLKGKIPAEHNLENDMARLALFGVSAMFTLGKGIGKIWNFFKDTKWSDKWIGFYKVTSNKKYENVKKSISDYKKKFDEWKKTKNESVLFEADEKKRKELLDGLNKLMYDEVIPYFYHKMADIDTSFVGKADNYIVKESNDGWNTKNSPSGNLTFIENTCVLLTTFLKQVKNDLTEPFEEFKTERVVTITNSIPNDMDYKDSYNTEFNKWCDNLEKDYGFKKFLEVYNSKFMRKPSSFKTYNDFLTYFPYALTQTSKVTKVVVLKNEDLTFKTDGLRVKVPGVITEDGANEENNEETVENDSIKQVTDKLKDLDKINDISSASDRCAELTADLDSAIEQINNNEKIKNSPLKAEYDKIENKDMFIKALYFKAAQKIMNESYWFGKTNILTEEENTPDKQEGKPEEKPAETNKQNYIEKFIKMLNDVSADNFKSFVEEYTKQTEEINKSYEDASGKSQEYNGKNPDGPFAKVVLMNAVNSSNSEGTNETIQLDPELQSKYDSIKKEIEALKGINKTSDAVDKLKTIEEQSNKTLEDLKTIIGKMENNDKKKSCEELINGLDKDFRKENLIKKLIYIKALMAKMSLKESKSFNIIMDLLFENKIYGETLKQVQEYKKQIFDVLNKDFTEEDIKNCNNVYKNFATKITELYNNTINNNLIDENIRKKLIEYKDDPLLLLFAMDDENIGKGPTIPEKIKKVVKTACDKIVSLSDKVEDDNFMKDVEEISNDNKEINKELEQQSNENPGIKNKFSNVLSKLGDIGKQTIPALWTKKKLSSQPVTDSWNMKRMLALLNEAEEQENKEQQDNNKPNFENLKKKSLYLLDNSLEELMKCEDENKFKAQYQKWLDNIKTLVDEIKKINNEDVNKRLDELQKEDPLKLAAACAKAIETLEKGQEGGEKPAEQQNNGENDETKQEGNQEGNQNTQQGQSSEKS